MHVKEVKLDKDLADDIAGDRFVICFNPEAAQRDATIRQRMLAQLDEAIAGSDKLSTDKRAELRGVLSTKPGLKRYLRVTPGGLLRIDRKAIDREANLDGKFLQRWSDPELSSEDIALGYQQLLEVERGWRDMKQIIDLRPVYHRREQRIRAHVLLCWLALLLIRDRRDHHHTDLAIDARRAPTPAPGHLHRPRRHLPATHRDNPAQRKILAALTLREPRRVHEATPAKR